MDNYSIRWITEPIYDSIDEISLSDEELIPVKKDSKWGFININGTMGGKQNIIFEPGPYGNIHINFYPDYLNSIVNVQKKFFTVRKISCTEM